MGVAITSYVGRIVSGGPRAICDGCGATIAEGASRLAAARGPGWSMLTFCRLTCRERCAA